jgi:hypothetical protein
MAIRTGAAGKRWRQGVDQLVETVLVDLANASAWRPDGMVVLLSLIHAGQAVEILVTARVMASPLLHQRRLRHRLRWRQGWGGG